MGCNWCGNKKSIGNPFPCPECQMYYYRDSLLKCDLIGKQQYKDSITRYENTFKNKTKQNKFENTFKINDKPKGKYKQCVEHGKDWALGCSKCSTILNDS